MPIKYNMLREKANVVHMRDGSKARLDGELANMHKHEIVHKSHSATLIYQQLPSDKHARSRALAQQ